jgi:uncharacterized protein involved in copper resistance
MKLIEVLSAAVLFLLPAAIVPAYAQKEHEQEKQPQQKQQASPTQHQQQAKPAQQHAQRQQQAKPAQQHAQRQPQAKPAPQHAQRQPQAKPEPQHAQRQPQANRAQPSAVHGRIPDDRFRASFGRDHTFHVNRSDFAGGSRRFQYGGFWFTMVDPWPVAWLFTDNVYVDYINGGYFLCDPVHPGVYISINVG